MFPCVYVSGSVYVCVRVCMYVCIYMCYVCIYVCECMHICMSVCTHVYTHVSIFYYLVMSVYTHPLFCTYFRFIPFCASPRGGQIHSLGYRLRHVRVISLHCTFPLRLVSANFGPSLFGFSVLVHFTGDSPGAKPVWFVFFSCTNFTGSVSLLFYMAPRKSAVTSQLSIQFCRHITPLYFLAPSYRP